jgi:WD40 repeat protein
MKPMNGSPLVEGKAGPNPFVGPRPFELGERLYGREREIGELHFRLNAERIVLFHSPSGAGKSSLVQAGLLPLLARSFDVWGPTRVNAEPAVAGVNRHALSAVQGLEEGVPKALRRPVEALAGQSLAAYFEKRPRRRSAPPNVLWIFDQFEEVLTVDPLAVEAKHEFFDQLGELLRNPRVWALFALREDYLAPLDPYAPQVPTHLKNRFRIDLLGLDAAREAMVEPAREGGRAFPAVGELVTDLATMKVQQADGTFMDETGQHVEPVQLQVVCRRLWDAMPEDDLSIDAEDLKRFGDVTQALAAYYADAVSRIAAGDPGRERAIRDWFGERLITAGGIRGQVLREAKASGGLDNVLIDQLRATHLVRAEKRAGATWYELAHDRLIEPVQRDNAAWRQQNLADVQRRAALWESQGRPPGMLLAGPELAEGERWAADHGALITETERIFLADSRKAQDLADREQRQVRRIRWLARGATVTTVLALAALGGVLWSSLAVRREARRSASRELALESTQLLDRQLDLALLLALEAEQISPTAEARRSLLAALQHNPRLWRFLPGGATRRHIAWRPGGPALAAAGESDAIELWDATTGKLLPGSPLHLKGGFEVQAVAFSPDGRWLAAGGKTADNGGLLGVWDLSATPPRQSTALRPGTVVRSLAFCSGSNSAQLAWITKDELSLLPLGGAVGPRTLQRGPRVMSLAITPDCTQLAVGHEEDGTIQLWNALAAQAPVMAGGPVETLAFDSAGRTLAAAGRRGDIDLWDLSGSRHDTLKGQGKSIHSLAFSPNGKTLAAAGDEKTIALWDVDTGAPAAQPLTGHDRAVTGVGYNPDGTVLASAGEDGKVILWKPAAAQRLARPLIGHRDEVWAVAFSPDGRRLVSGEGRPEDGTQAPEHSGDEGTVRLWDLGTGQSTLLPGSTGPTGAVAFSPDGRRIAAGSADSDGVLHLWGLSEAAQVEALRHWNAKTPVNALVFSPDGGSLLVAEGRDLVQWDLALAPPRGRTLGTHSGNIWSLLIRHAGRSLLASDETGQILVWDVAAGRQKALLKPEPSSPQILAALAESPDGRLVAAASREGGSQCVLLWEMPSGTFRRCLPGHRDQVSAVAFAADGRLFSADLGGEMIVWDSETRQEVGRLPHGAPGVSINGLAVSPDGRTLASASNDHTILLWDLDWQRVAHDLAGRELSKEECKNRVHFDDAPCNRRR